ncbi:MAG: hypothetical protein ACRDHO_04615 [Actinomycetota bacterium]
MTGRTERQWMGDAARTRLASVGEPRPAVLQRLFRSWSWMREEALGRKDRELGLARGARWARRARVRARRLTWSAQAHAEVSQRIGKLHQIASSTLAMLELAFGPAYRDLSHRAFRLRKFILSIGEVMGVTLVYAVAWDVPYGEAALLAAATALALIIGGDLGGELRLHREWPRVAALLRKLKERNLELGPPPNAADPGWLRLLWISASAMFGLAGIAIGVLRASAVGRGLDAAAFAVLTTLMVVASGVTSWRHASPAADLIEAGRKAERTYAVLYKKEAGSRTLRRWGAARESVAVRTERAERLGAAREHLAEATKAKIAEKNPGQFGHGTELDHQQSPVGLPTTEFAPGEPAPVSGDGGGPR